MVLATEQKNSGLLSPSCGQQGPNTRASVRTIIVTSTDWPAGKPPRFNVTFWTGEEWMGLASKPRLRPKLVRKGPLATVSPQFSPPLDAGPASRLTRVDSLDHTGWPF